MGLLCQFLFCFVYYHLKCSQLANVVINDRSPRMTISSDKLEHFVQYQHRYSTYSGSERGAVKRSFDSSVCVRGFHSQSEM